MEPIEMWKFAQEVTVIQAALLMVGQDPAPWQRYIEDRTEYDRPPKYTAISTLLKNDIKNKRLPAEIWFHELKNSAGEFETLSEEIDWEKTQIKTEDIKNWLREKDLRDGFFLKDEPTEDFLDKNNPCYAPKLAAAISAWKDVARDPKLTNGKTPKQAIEKWLYKNADEFRLTKDDGTPNKHAISSICNIANWKPEGGAAKTPT